MKEASIQWIPAKLSSPHVIPHDPSSTAHQCLGTHPAQGSLWFPNKALMSPDSAAGEVQVLLKGQEGWTLATKGQLL